MVVKYEDDTKNLDMDLHNTVRAMHNKGELKV